MHEPSNRHSPMSQMVSSSQLLPVRGKLGLQSFDLNSNTSRSKHSFGPNNLSITSTISILKIRLFISLHRMCRQPSETMEHPKQLVANNRNPSSTCSRSNLVLTFRNVYIRKLGPNSSFLGWKNTKSSLSNKFRRTSFRNVYGKFYFSSYFVR